MLKYDTNKRHRAVESVETEDAKIMAQEDENNSIITPKEKSLRQIYQSNR